MSLRSWLALLLFCVLYLLVGGYIFNAIECPAEMVEKEREAAERRDVRMLVLDLKGEKSVCFFKYPVQYRGCRMSRNHE